MKWIQSINIIGVDADKLLLPSPKSPSPFTESRTFDLTDESAEITFSFSSSSRFSWRHKSRKIDENRWRHDFVSLHSLPRQKSDPLSFQLHLDAVILVNNRCSCKLRRKPHQETLCSICVVRCEALKQFCKIVFLFPPSLPFVSSTSTRCAPQKQSPQNILFVNEKRENKRLSGAPRNRIFNSNDLCKNLA